MSLGLLHLTDMSRKDPKTGEAVVFDRFSLTLKRGEKLNANY